MKVFAFFILAVIAYPSFAHQQLHDQVDDQILEGTKGTINHYKRNAPQQSSRPAHPKYDDIISLHPLARCLLNFVDKSVAERDCISKCPTQRRDREFKSLRIYDYRQQTHEKLFCVCNTYEYTNNYIETWTFSKIKSSPQITRIQTNQSDCDKLFSKICRGTPCHATGYKESNEHFSWASDNTVIEKASVLSVGSGLSYWLESLGYWAFSFPGHDTSLKDSDGKFYDKLHDNYYLWKPVDVNEMAGCPLKTSHIHVCEVIGVGEYWCPALRVYLKSTGEIVKMKECGDLVIHRDKSYFFEILPDHPVDMSADSSFIYDMDPKRQLNDLVHLINSVFLTRDTKSCIQECTSLLNNRPAGSLLMAGYQYWSDSGNGSVSSCIPEFNCQIYNPIIYCTMPVMIKVKCSSGIVWFNLDTFKTSAWAHCLKREEQVEKAIAIPIKGGTLLINTTGSYLLKHSMNNYIQHPHPLTNPHLTGEKLDYHTRDHHESVIASPESYDEKKIGKSSLGNLLNWILYPFALLRDWLSTIEHNVKVAIFFVFFTSIIVFILLIFSRYKPAQLSNKKSMAMREADRASVHLI